MRRREVMATITTFMYEKESTDSKIVRKDKDTQGYVKNDRWIDDMFAIHDGMIG